MFGGTEKQESFIRDLMVNRAADDGTDRTIAEMVESTVDGGVDALVARIDSKSAASALISELLAKPRPSRPVTQLRPEPPVAIHFLDGTVYKIQQSRTSGRLYAKKLVPRGEGEKGEWVYDARKAFGRLSEDTVMTLEQAEEFGHRYGICGICGATLENEQSVERGIGPVCFRRLGVAA